MTITIYCFRVYCCPHLHLGLFLVSLLKNHQLENFRLAIVDLSSICFDFGLFSKNFLAPSVTFKFSRTKVITHALLMKKLCLGVLDEKLDSFERCFSQQHGPHPAMEHNHNIQERMETWKAILENP